MANFEKKKIDLSSINGGVRYENGDIVTADAINVPIEGIGYAQEVAEEALGKAKTFYLHQFLYSIPNGGALNSNNKYLEVFVVNTIPDNVSNAYGAWRAISGNNAKVPIFKSCLEKVTGTLSSAMTGRYDILCAIQASSTETAIGILSSSGQILMEQGLILIDAKVIEYDL